MNPPTGHYRKIIGDKFPDVRIGFTHTPIVGYYKIDPTPILDVLDNSTDEHSKFYSDGLRNGTLVTIKEIQRNNVFRNNGELFFTT